MIFWNNKQQYFSLIGKLIDQTISGVEFEARFTSLWRLNRDNEISTCFNKYNALSQEVNLFNNLLSEIFSACDVFDPDPDTREDYEYDEESLRRFVQCKFQEFKSAIS